MTNMPRQISLRHWFEGERSSQVWVEPTHRKVGLFLDEFPAPGSVLHLLSMVDTSAFAPDEQVPSSRLPDGVRQAFDEFGHVVEEQIRSVGLEVATIESGRVVTDTHRHHIGYKPGNEGGAPGSLWKPGRSLDPNLRLYPLDMLEQKQLLAPELGQLAVAVFDGVDWSVLARPRRQ